MARWLLPAAVVLLAGVVALFAFTGAGGGDDEGGVDAATLEEVADVAGRFGQALFTYDADSLGASRATLAELGTDRFAELYEETLDEGLAGTIGETGGSATAEVREVYVGPVLAGEASAIVVIDADIEGSGGQRQFRGLYLRLDLLRGEDDVWRVDQLTVLTAESTDQS